MEEMMGGVYAIQKLLEFQSFDTVHVMTNNLARIQGMEFIIQQ